MQILFITYYFPPRRAIACVRTYALCTGLLKAGHNVHVVTSCGSPPLADVAGDMFNRDCTQGGRLRVSRVRSWWHDLHDGPGVRRAKGLLDKVWAVFARVVGISLSLIGFDEAVPWALAAWAAVDPDVPYDCVLVSAGPFSTLFTGYALARSNGLPLILDYRDVWNDSPHTAVRCSTRWLERILLARSALVVSVSPSCLKSIVGDSKVPGIVITNGISEDVSRVSRVMHPSQPTSLVYAGAFYPPKRSFKPIAAALQLLRSRHPASPPIAFSYFGPSSTYVEEVAQQHGVENLVHAFGPVSRHEAMVAQADSLCTVVVTSTERTCSLADRGIVTGKLFEAIALAPWVLVISPLDSDVRSLTASLPHVKHFHGEQTQAIANWLDEIASAAIEPRSADYWKNLAWPHLADHFSEQIDFAVRQWRSPYASRLA